MKRLILAAFALVIIATGCTSSGAFIAANQTIVNLEDGNYSLTATNVMGESEAGYVIGVSFSSGPFANTLALARVNGTGMLYAEALQNLWNNYEANHGAIGDKKLALANVRYDADMLNFILYTKVKVMVRADIVEFE